MRWCGGVVGWWWVATVLTRRCNSRRRTCSIKVAPFAPLTVKRKSRFAAPPAVTSPNAWLENVEELSRATRPRSSPVSPGFFM